MVGTMKANNLNSRLIADFFTGMSITGDLSDSSICKYRDSIRKFLAVLHGKFIGDLNIHDFDTFILTMKKNGASGSRIRNVISAMKALIVYLQRERLIDTQLDLERIRKPKVERKEVAYLTDDEIILILKSVRKDIQKGVMIRKVRMMALLLVMLQTAARLGEALSIRIKDVDRINMEIPIMGRGGSLEASSYRWIRFFGSTNICR